MTFEQWMTHRGLSPASVKKYEGAISGAISKWAMDSGLVEGPLTSITSRLRFDGIVAKIHALPIFHERNERGRKMYSNALIKFSEYLSEGYVNDVETDIEAIIEDRSLDATEKSTLIKARIGQGAFRQKLVAYWGGCSVTGFKDTNLLVASHIKPWRASGHAERLDKFNGLLLLPNLDKAFDAGLITFGLDGYIKISPQLLEPEKLGITPKLRVALASEHESYMTFHRSVFRAT